MKTVRRFLFPLIALVAIALSFAGVALAREVSERDFFNASEREIEITGVVESFDGSTLVINGQTIVVPVSAEIKGEIAVGQAVKVHALVGENDTLTAREIEPAIPGVIGDDDSANINADDDLDDDLGDDSANINADDDLDDDLGDDSANINADDDLDDDLDDDSANINADDDLDDDNDNSGSSSGSDNDNDDDDNDNSGSGSGSDNDDDDNDNSGSGSGSDNDDDGNDNSGHDDDDDDD